MNRLPHLLVASLILVPLLAIAAGGDVDALSTKKVPLATSSYQIRVIDDTVRPSWLPDRPIFPSSGLGVGGEKTMFNAVDTTQLPADCTDPSLTPAAFVMLQRVGACPAPRLSTRFEW